MIPQNWGLSVGGGRWDAQNTIEGDLFGIIFFAAIVNMRIFVYFCQDVLVHIFGHNWVGEQEGFVTHRHTDLGSDTLQQLISAAMGAATSSPRLAPSPVILR